MQTPRQQAEEVVKRILDDLTDRKGLRHAWESIDEEIQQEIIEAWRESAFEVIAGVPA